ncbi:MAG: Crp/Fnr family transcriptional regulator [Bacteriovoracaceae bacterium]|nr:Crp/Fnr family transcriptional regulator [Bacteriovoracaceae bacterium]
MALLSDQLRSHLQSMVSSPIERWEDLEQITKIKNLRKGEHFFQHFDNCDEVAIVSSGLFRFYLIDQEGEEKTYSFIQEKGFIIDFFLTWENSPSMVSCQAIEDSTIYTIKYSALVELMEKESVWNDIYREILRRAYMSKTKREIEFVLHNAKERLKRCMNSKHLDVSRVPKTYLASYLGIAPPSLSRLLRDMKEKEA